MLDSVSNTPPNVHLHMLNYSDTFNLYRLKPIKAKQVMGGDEVDLLDPLLLSFDILNQVNLKFEMHEHCAE